MLHIAPPVPHFPAAYYRGSMLAGKGHDTRRRAHGSGGRHGSKAVTLITSARKSPLQDWNNRRKIYASLQLARIPLLGLAGLLMWWTNNLWISASVAAISLPLPWIAVLLANEKGDVDRRSQRVYKPQVAREARQAVALEQATQRQLGQEQQALDPDATLARNRESAPRQQSIPPRELPPHIIDLD